MKSNRGFTLIEMVVVLGIMAILATLALPALQKMYESLQRSVAREDMVDTLGSIAIWVRHGGDSVILDSFPGGSANLPSVISQKLMEQKLTFLAAQPILITGAGLCPIDGKIIAVREGVSYRLNMRSPDCRVFSIND